MNCGFGATGHDVEQLRPQSPGAGHRHDPGDELGVLSAAGGQERGLVDADGGDVQAVLADQPARLPPGPLSQ